MEAGSDREYSKLNHKYSKRLKIQKMFLSHSVDMPPKVDLEIPGKESNQIAANHSTTSQWLYFQRKACSIAHLIKPRMDLEELRIKRCFKQMCLISKAKTGTKTNTTQIQLDPESQIRLKQSRNQTKMINKICLKMMVLMRWKPWLKMTMIWLIISCSNVLVTMYQMVPMTREWVQSESHLDKRINLLKQFSRKG